MVVTKNFKFLAQTIKAKIQWLSERFSNHKCLRFNLWIIFLMYMYNTTKCPEGFHRLKAKIGTVRSKNIFKLIQLDDDI